MKYIFYSLYFIYALGNTQDYHYALDMIPLVETNGGIVSGELRQYHKTTITFNALDLSEAPGTYLDHRMNVTITTPSSTTYVVPAYFAADGDASETSATSGNKWRCHFTPEEIGSYTYSVSFRTGTNVAIDLSPTAGSPTSINGESGTFSITSTNKSGNDFRAKGKLEYNGTDTAQFANGDYYFEVGADSPETFLEYGDFDGTNGRHDFAEVGGNYVTGEPSWQNGKGTEIIGAINYLANQGMNVHYFLTMNITGDGQRAYPFPNNTAYTTYDVSKLDQWQIVFDHMYNKGITLEFVLLETENTNWFEMKEGISFSGFANSRKLYYREIIARFGYLNVFYNIGEEANWNAGGDQYSASQIEEAAAYIQSLTPYNDLVSIHNGPANSFTLFPALTALSGTSSLTAISMQGQYEVFSHGFNQLRNIKNLSTAEGKEWVVRYTEPYAGTLPNLETWTKNSLWASITAGATGIHYYSYNGDVGNDNYTNYITYYQRMRYAKEFLENNSIPFWDMSNDNNSISNGYLLSDGSLNYVAFLPNGGTTTIDLSGSSNFTVKWFDPRNGGGLQNGSVINVSSGTNISIGNPPNNTTSSWVALVAKNIIIIID